MPGRSMKLCANLSFLFTDVPFVDRFGRAARAGFAGVEYMFPYDYDADELTRRGRGTLRREVASGRRGPPGPAPMPGRDA